MPMMEGWKAIKNSLLSPLITALTVAFFVFQWDTKTGNIKWSGIGKYVNYAFIYTGILCAVMYLVGYYRKKWTLLMRPILYLLGLGIVFGLTAAICFPFDLDITGNTAGQTMTNGTHFEALPIPSATNTDVSTTKSSSDAKETTENEFTSVYCFAFIRSFFCLVLWIFHYSNYVDKCNGRKEKETKAANVALP